MDNALAAEDDIGGPCDDCFSGDFVCERSVCCHGISGEDALPVSVSARLSAWNSRVVDVAHLYMFLSHI
jgi:hypothetical protein